MLQDIYFIAEIVGVVAVVGSLLFVGVQMRQNTSALRAAVANDMVSTWQNVMQPFSTNTEFIEALEAVDAADPDTPLPRDVVIRMAGFWSPSFKNCEFAYYRNKAGEMDDGLWLAIKNGALAPFNNPVWMQQIWPNLRLGMSPEFSAFIETCVLDGEHLRMDEEYGPSRLLD